MTLETAPDISADDAAAIAADILGTTPEGGTGAETAEGKATASDGDAQVAAEEPEAKADAAVEGDGKEEPAEAGGKTPDPLDAFIASKYGGDRSKFMDGLWHLMNSGSAQHKQIQELRTKLEEALAKPPEKPIDPMDTQDGQGLKQQLSAVVQRVQAANAEQDDILSRVEKTKEGIAELRGEQKRAEDFDKARISSEISALQAELRADERRFRELEAHKSDYSLRKAELDERVRALRTAHAEQQQSRQQAEAQAKQAGVRFLDDLNAAVDEAVSSQGLKPDSLEYGKARGKFFRYLQGQAALHWQQNPATPLDPEEFVKLHRGDFFDEDKAAIAAAAAKRAKEKLAASPAAPGKSGAPGKPAAASPTLQPPKGKMTLQQSLEWRKRFLA